MRRALVTALAAASMVAMASSAQAAIVVGDGFAVGGLHGGNDCALGGGVGFSGCWITANGTTTTQPPADQNPSRVVAAIGTNGSTSDISTNYPTIDGSEFTVSFNGTSHVLSFLYGAGAGDPILHYITIKQANGYEIFYNSAANGFASGTTYTFDLDNYFGRQSDSFSHVTVWDSAGGVPEPATWAMMLVGFGGIGMAMRRRRRNGGLLQVA